MCPNKLKLSTAESYLNSAIGATIFWFFAFKKVFLSIIHSLYFFMLWVRLYHNEIILVSQ